LDILESGYSNFLIEPMRSEKREEARKPLYMKLKGEIEDENFQQKNTS